MVYGCPTAAVDETETVHEDTYVMFLLETDI
jgi:hypothetical protein